MPVTIHNPPELAGEADARARRILRRNRRLATGLLVGMIVVFVVNELFGGTGFLTRLIRAASEAGIVGGMADWFAVTALFRHPLGLPIPHTAILPQNKDRIGRALGRFIERGFLTPEVLLQKVREVSYASRLAHWLATPVAARALAEVLAKSIPHVAGSFATPELREFARNNLARQLRDADVWPLVGRALRLVTASDEAGILFDHALDATARWLHENRSEFDALVEQRRSWWIPKQFNRRIAATLVEGAIEVLLRLRQPESEARRKLRESFSTLVEDMMHSPAQRHQLNAIKNRLLDNPDVQAWMSSVGRDLTDIMIKEAASSRPNTRAALERVVASFGSALAADKAMQAKIDGFLEELAGQAISWRGEISVFIVDVVRNWDATTLADRLELVIGGDLQYIRINGTIVGALVGCLIFLLTSAFG
jgi:uncharacterized membrane-anchored protein YjiN (DUF445 family)